ncbi:hypothetical protein EIP91_001532 [Steccherinum ochraceum]|uniref:DUF6534 domain-containing protein n=1 Tax=Steccherinum ochraceum TaxID=92696 RepID=A0A4R0RQ28_9APHY|nr:hypothetical protein EIP91_001532 [Steccherinum ochraceum]
MLNLTLQLGPMLLTWVLNWGLFGMLTVQLYIYHLAFRTDRVHIKTLVFGIYILELVQLVLVTRDGFAIFAAQWGEFEHLGDIRLLWFSMPIMTGLVSCPVQLFYAWRLYGLSKNLFVTGTVVLAAILQFAFAIWDGIEVHAAGNLQAGTSEGRPKYTASAHCRSRSHKIIHRHIAATVLCDLLITVFMTFYLWRAKTQITISRTNDLLSRLIRYTVETGLITSTFAVLEAIFFATSRNTLLYALCLGVVPKLYSNSLLAVLNSRLRFSNGQIAAADVSGIHFLSTNHNSSNDGVHLDAFGTSANIHNGTPQAVNIAKISNVKWDDSPPPGDAVESSKLDNAPYRTDDSPSYRDGVQ